MKRYLQPVLPILLFVLGFLLLTPQVMASDKRKVVKEADGYYKKGDYKKALELYRQIYNDSSTFVMDEDELFFRIGYCYYQSPNLNDQEHSLKYFEEYIVSGEEWGEANYYMAQVHQKFHRFDEAIEHYETFRESVKLDTISPHMIIRQILQGINHDISRCQYGKILVENPRDVVVENLGPTINTEHAEYAPVITAKETQLVFTSRRPEGTGHKKAYDGDWFEDIFHSDILEGSLYDPKKNDQSRKTGYISSITPFKFSDPVHFGHGINTDGHEGAIQFSPDGNSLYIYRSYKLWKSEFRDGKWHHPVEMTEIASITDDRAFEPSITITPDESVIIFSSDRKGGFGGLDLYRSEKQSDGTWGEPVNLGKHVNTQYDEDGPYIDPDGKTLYFSSKGHSSMGGYDVFKTKYSGVDWSQPYNMGYPINSAGQDIFFVMTPDFNRGYYSSDKAGGHGRQDLYRLTFPNERPPLAEIRGVITTGDAAAPAAKIVVRDLDKDKEEVGTYYSDSLGQYLLLFAHGKNYEVSVYTEDFLPYVHEFRIPKQVYYYQFYQEIHHIQIKDEAGNVIGEKVTVSNPVIELDTTPPPPKLEPLPELPELAELDTMSLELLEADSVGPLTRQSALDLPPQLANAFALALLARDSAALSLLFGADAEFQDERLDSIALAYLARDTALLAELGVSMADVDFEGVRQFTMNYLDRDEADMDLIELNYEGMSLSEIALYVIDTPEVSEELSALEPEQAASLDQVEEVDVIFYVSQDSVRKILSKDTTLNIELTENTTLAFFEPELMKDSAATDTADVKNPAQYVRQEVVFTPPPAPAPVAEVKKLVSPDTASPAPEEADSTVVEAEKAPPPVPVFTMTLGAMLDTLEKRDTVKKVLVENLDSLKTKTDVVVVESGEDDLVDANEGLEEAMQRISKIIVLFEYERTSMSQEFKNKLNVVVDLMKAYPQMSFGVVGHTDSKGSEALNQSISEKRARTVMKYLSSQGIKKDRLEARGKGESAPIAKNEFEDGQDNPEGRALNRRVEFIPVLKEE